MYKPKQHYKAIRKDGTTIRLMEGQSDPNCPFYVTVNNVPICRTDTFADAYRIYNATFRI